MGDDHLFLAVVRRRHALIQFDASKGGRTSSGFVGGHSPDGLVKDSGGGSVMERTVLLRVNQVSLVHMVSPTKLQAEKAAGYIDFFATNNDDLLAGKGLFSYD